MHAIGDGKMYYMQSLKTMTVHYTILWRPKSFITDT